MDDFVREGQYINKAEAVNSLQLLKGKTLSYAIKSPDLTLYDLGFGDFVVVDTILGPHNICEYMLHISSAIRIYWKGGGTEEYWGDTACSEIVLLAKRLVDCPITRVTLSDKNDLWIDFGICRMVIITTEDAEESWRFFSADINLPHLIASDTWISL